MNEDRRVGQDLPDKEFQDTRKIILNLMKLLFPDGSMKYGSMELTKGFIDNYVDEIGMVWKRHYEAKETAPKE